MKNNKSMPYYKQNRLKQLRAFCFAAKNGSISKAAEQLFLSQPSVSLQIKALENELGITLFERRGPVISLTPEGEKLHTIARPLMEGIDALPEMLAEELGNLQSGKLRIAAGESTMLHILPEYVRRFHEVYPGIQVHLNNVTGRDGMAMLRNDEVELAIGSMATNESDIDYHPLFEYPTVLICAKDHPLASKKKISLKDISPYGLILPPKNLHTWGMVELAFRQRGLPYNVCVQAGGWEVIKKYVAQGTGVSIVSAVCLAENNDLHVHDLDKYFSARTYGVVLRTGKYLSPPAKRFIELMSPNFFS